MGERIPKLSAEVHGTCHWLAGKRRLSKAETCPSSSHRSRFQSAPSRTSLQSTSTLPSTAHVRTSLEPHLEPFTSCSFCPDDRPCAQSLLTARESHVLHLLACAGMAVNTHGVHLEQAELLLRPRSDFGGLVLAWCWPAPSRWVVLARCRIGLDELFTSDNDQGVFEHLRLVDVLLVCTSTGLLIDRVRGTSRCVCLCFLSAAEMVGVGVG
jgi:hypothetical protein